MKVSDAGYGFFTGATLGLVGHLGALVASAEGAPHDQVSRRISDELARLASDTSRFALAVTLAVMAAAGLAGVLAACLWRWTGAPSRGRRPAVLALTGATLAALVLRAFLAQPALLEPALGGSHGRLAAPLARLATWLSPAHVDAAAAVLLLALLGIGALRRRGSIARAARGLAGRARSHWRAWAAVSLLALALTALWARHRPAAPALLVIAADSLRPDRMTPLTTPNLDALSSRGLAFDLALSAIARTTPSWISILTGLYPQSHGVRHMFPRRELRPDYLDYLPRRLARAGYRTVLVTDYAGDFFPLFELGFERAETPPPLTLGLVFERELMSRSPLALALLNHPVGRRLFPVLRYLMTNSDPERLADQALAALDDSDSRPTALFVFFSTTHVPFAAPAPYYRRFASPGYGGAHRYAYDAQRLADVTAADATLPAADVQQIRALYDGALAAVDAAAGRLIARSTPATQVVLLSDHGENLFEAGTTTHHGKWFRGGDESIRVPLVFAGPTFPARRVAEPVSLVDVAPTVADLLGLPAAPADGRSLLGARTGALERRDLFAETGVWLNGPAEPDGVRYPPLGELLEADRRDHFQLVLKSRYEDPVVEAKHRLLRRGPVELLYLPTPSGVRWLLRGGTFDARQQAELERALLAFLRRDPERELDARDHLIRRAE